MNGDGYMNKFDVIYHENYDNQNMKLDMHNPRYVMSLPGVDEIIYLIASNEKNKYTKDAVIKELNCSVSLIDNLIEVGALSLNNGFLIMACPFFFEKDILIIQKKLDDIANNLANKIIENKTTLYASANGLSNGRLVKDNLYHVICGMIFDGMLYDELENVKLIRTHKVQMNNLDYMIVLCENTPLVRKLSRELLCSYNRYGNAIGSFESFGDMNGERLDFYSFVRQFEVANINPIFTPMLDVYNTLPDKEHFRDNLVTSFVNYFKGRSIDDKYKKMLELTGYIKNNGINVDVFYAKDAPIIAKVYAEVKKLLLDDIQKALIELESINELSIYTHVIDKLDAAYELCNLIFGSVNEKIVKASFVAMPPYFDGQGRYRKIFRFLKNI